MQESMNASKEIAGMLVVKKSRKQASKAQECIQVSKEEAKNAKCQSTWNYDRGKQGIKFHNP